MKTRIILFAFCFVFISCDRQEKLQFEKFSFIGFIWNYEHLDSIPTLRIVQYLEMSSKSKILYSNYYNRKEKCYVAHFPESLIGLINQNFTNTNFDTIPKPHISLYDGPLYCYCIKKPGEKEMFYYYNPYSLPPKWKAIYTKLDSLVRYDTLEKLSINQDLRNRLKEIESRFEWQKEKMPKITGTIVFEAPENESNTEPHKRQK